jgi:hypothetical protein
MAFWERNQAWDEDEIDEEDMDILGPDLFVSRDEDMVARLPHEMGVKLVKELRHGLARLDDQEKREIRE